MPSFFNRPSSKYMTKNGAGDSSKVLDQTTLAQRVTADGPFSNAIFSNNVEDPNAMTGPSNSDESDGERKCEENEEEERIKRIAKGQPGRLTVDLSAISTNSTPQTASSTSSTVAYSGNAPLRALAPPSSTAIFRSLNEARWRTPLNDLKEQAELGAMIVWSGSYLWKMPFRQPGPPKV